MDVALQFWPKIGDRVSYSGAVLGEKWKTSQFSVKEIKEEYPCTYYIIEDIKTQTEIVPDTLCIGHVYPCRTKT